MIKKLIFILGEKATKRVIILFFFMVIGSVFEAFGIGLILPFIEMINNPGDIGSKYGLDTVYQWISPPSHEIFLIFLGGTLFFVYLFKNAFLLLLTYVQSHFIYHQQARISNELLFSYLYCPYTFHLQRNTPELLRNLTMSMGTIFGNGIIPLLVILAEVPVVLSITILLLVVQPAVTAVAAIVIGSLTILFYKYVRNKMAYYGSRVQETGMNMILWATQSIEGIKEIKLLGKEPFFLNHFYKHRLENSKVNIYFTIVQKIPRLYLEVILMAGMLIVMTVIIFQGGKLLAFIPTISLFALASIRILPSVNQIVTSMNAMKFGTAAVDDIYREIRYFREHVIKVNPFLEKRDMKVPDKIEADALCFTYPGTDTPIFKNISFSIHRGTSVALVGPSGSGKTTLVNILLGLLPPDKGRLMVNGINIIAGDQSMSSWQRNIGYVPQDSYMINDSLKRNIALGVNDEEISPDRIRKVIMQANLEEAVRQLPEGLETNIGEQGIRLSGGQRQRVSIARALYHDPSVIVMDEATSALDNETESEIAESIEGLKADKIVIVIAHRLSTIKKCDCLYFIKDGGLCDTGTYQELIERNADFRKMLQHKDLH